MVENHLMLLSVFIEAVGKYSLNALFLLGEIGKFVRLFSRFSVLSIYAESTFCVQDNQKIKFVICS